MAYIDNTETARELVEAIRGNANTNLPPRQVNNSIQPVIDINPKQFRRSNICVGTIATANSDTTLLTTDSTKEFFLTSASLSGCKDATCDIPTGQWAMITAFPEGQTSSRAILGLSGITLTAQNQSITQTFATPLKLARGTVISGSRGGAFTVGNNVRHFTIQGYYVEP